MSNSLIETVKEELKRLDDDFLEKRAPTRVYHLNIASLHNLYSPLTFTKIGCEKKVKESLKTFKEYKIKKIFIEELRGDKADFIVEIMLEDSFEFYSFAEVFENIDKSSAKKLAEFWINSAEYSFDRTALKELIVKTFEKHLPKTKLYAPGEIVGVYKEIITLNFEKELFNDALRYALQAIYSRMEWKGILGEGIKWKSYGREDLEEFLKKLNKEQKKACDVYYKKYTSPHLWEEFYKKKYEIAKKKGMVEIYYLLDLTSALKFKEPLFIKLCDVSLSVS